MSNEKNLRSLATLTTNEQRRIQSAGGKASGKARRERKTIADALRMILGEKAAEGSGQTKLDALVAKTLANFFRDPNVKGLKTLAEILGELNIPIDLGEKELNIVVRSKEEKKKINDIGKLDI